MTDLLTRDEFREQVFARDGHKCIICGRSAVDAHHIIERRLFPDGGYFTDNGASLCATHHIAAESTQLSTDDIRAAAGITRVVLPPHLYGDTRYDKWGNPFVEGAPSGLRTPGELYHDPSVQRIIVGEFVRRVKYPRTYHLPWSSVVDEDDRVLDSVDSWIGTEIVITEKMDGENTTMYRDYMHARSLDSGSHPSRDWVRRLHGALGWAIPEGWRVCGENLYAKHAIFYAELSSYFLVFSIWNEQNVCFSWDETLEWAELLGFHTVPLLWRGTLESTQQIEEIWVDGTTREGYVVRPARSFQLREFRSVVGKYVRANHVQTHGHWMRQALEPNKLVS